MRNVIAKSRAFRELEIVSKRISNAKPPKPDTIKKYLNDIETYCLNCPECGDYHHPVVVKNKTTVVRNGQLLDYFKIKDYFECKCGIKTKPRERDPYCFVGDLLDEGDKSERELAKSMLMFFKEKKIKEKYAVLDLYYEEAKKNYLESLLGTRLDDNKGVSMSGFGLYRVKDKKIAAIKVICGSETEEERATKRFLRWILKGEIKIAFVSDEKDVSNILGKCVYDFDELNDYEKNKHYIEIGALPIRFEKPFDVV